jgi:transcriptional regulator with XRE-family HTH domain
MNANCEVGAPEPTGPFKEPLGKRIERLMNAKGWSQTMLSDRSGVERSQLNRYINGHRNPSPEDIGSFAQALGVTPEELLDGAELPDNVRRAIDHAVSLTERALRAERERDEAQAIKAAAEEALALRTDASLKVEQGDVPLAFEIE